MSEDKSISKWFGENLAVLLANKIRVVYKDFDSKGYIKTIKNHCEGLSYTKRIELHTDVLRQYLPPLYPQAIKILIDILGEENPNETGMFTHFYWVMPIGKFVEKYGLEDFDISLHAIEEITKRNTGEYAIRPYARKYPTKTLAVCTKWAKSKNFHLRRLASEGLRPKLPWSTKLNIWNNNPKPVFEILEILKEERYNKICKKISRKSSSGLDKSKPKRITKTHQ